MNTATDIAREVAERLERARKLLEEGRVYPVRGNENLFVVLSGESAHLAGFPESCTCEDYQYRAKPLGIPCKHLLAAALYRERQRQQQQQQQRPQQNQRRKKENKPSDGGSDKPLRRYQCDRCGAVEESDTDLTGERCRLCLLLDPTAPRGRFQPVETVEM